MTCEYVNMSHGHGGKTLCNSLAPPYLVHCNGCDVWGDAVACIVPFTCQVVDHSAVQVVRISMHL